MTEIVISQDLTNILQKAQLEVQSRIDILNFINTEELKLPQEQVQQYQNELIEKQKEFIQAKMLINQEIKKQLHYSQTDNIRWNLDYTTNIVQVETK